MEREHMSCSNPTNWVKAPIAAVLFGWDEKRWLDALFLLGTRVAAGERRRWGSWFTSRLPNGWAGATLAHPNRRGRIILR